MRVRVNFTNRNKVGQKIFRGGAGNYWGVGPGKNASSFSSYLCWKKSRTGRKKGKINTRSGDSLRGEPGG